MESERPKSMCNLASIRNYYRLIVLLVVTRTAYCCWLATSTSPTLNEPKNLIAAKLVGENGCFHLASENPPHLRLLAGTFVDFSNLAVDHGLNDARFGRRRSDTIGEIAFNSQPDVAFGLLVKCRIVIVLLSALTPFGLALLAIEVSGYRTALAVIFLWAIDPFQAANSSVFTYDAVFVSCFLWFIAAAASYSRRSSLESAAHVGLAFGALASVKYSAVAISPIFLWLLVRRPTSIRQIIGERFLRFCVGSSVAMGFIWLPFVFYTDCEHTRSQLSSVALQDSWAGDVALLLFPYDYVEGVDRQLVDHERASDLSYAFGKWNKRGWWWFYIIGLVVKTPIFILLFAVFGVWRLWTVSTLPDRKEEIGIMALSAALLLVLVSSHTRFTHHVRYVLPVNACICFFAGFGVERAIKSRTRGSLLLILPIVAMSLAWTSSFCLSPIGYRSSLFMRSHSPPLLFSNADWGQDVNRLQAWIEDNGVSDPALILCETTKVRIISAQSLMPHSLSFARARRSTNPYTGKYSTLIISDQYRWSPDVSIDFDREVRHTRIGSSISVFSGSSGSIRFIGGRSRDEE